MSKDKYKVGMIVRLKKLPEWGQGKIVDVDGTILTVVFDNVGEKEVDSTTAPLAIVKKTETKEIEIRDHASLESIAKAMKNKEQFIIITDDKNFNPLGYDRYSSEMWIGAAGGGILMTIGAGALILAFMDPEPTTKLGLLVGGGILMTLTGGGVIITILVTRSKYTSVMRFNKDTQKYEWILEPR